MSSDKITLSVEKRKITGKKVRVLREAGLLPATVYEKGKDSISVQMPFMDMVKTWREAGKSQPIEMTVDGKKLLTIIKDVSYDPVKAVLTHVSFQAIKQDVAIEAEVAIRIEGDVPAEKQGNFIVRPNKEVIVKALPANLPEVLVVSAETLLEPGDSLKVSDIELPEGVEIISEGELPLAVVEEPRAIEEPEEEEEDEDAADVPSEHGGDGDEGEESSDDDSKDAKSEKES